MKYWLDFEEVVRHHRGGNGSIWMRKAAAVGYRLYLLRNGIKRLHLKDGREINEVSISIFCGAVLYHFRIEQNNISSCNVQIPEI